MSYKGDGEMIQTEIRKLVQYGLLTGLVPEEDKIYTTNSRK